MSKEELLARGGPINNPQHYNHGSIETIDAIEDWGCGFHDGNAIKYLARYKHKGNPIADLEKAKWYIEKLLKHLREDCIDETPTVE